MLSAVIDNNSLIYFFSLNDRINKDKDLGFDVFILLKEVYKEILIPIQIKEEFGLKADLFPVRSLFLDSLRDDSDFIKLCNRFNSSDLEELKKDFDLGEAGAIAQSQKVLVPIFITDDKNCISLIAKKRIGITAYSSLVVLATLDLKGLLFDVVYIFVQFKEIRKFSKGLLEQAYHEAGRQIGISKKIITEQFRLKFP